MVCLCHSPALARVPVHLLPFNLLVHTSPLTLSTNEKIKKAQYGSTSLCPRALRRVHFSLHHKFSPPKMLRLLWSPSISHQNTGSPCLKFSVSPPKELYLRRPPCHKSPLLQRLTAYSRGFPAWWNPVCLKVWATWALLPLFRADRAVARWILESELWNLKDLINHIVQLSLGSRG